MYCMGITRVIVRDAKWLRMHQTSSSIIANIDMALPLYILSPFLYNTTGLRTSMQLDEEKQRFWYFRIIMGIGGKREEPLRMTLHYRPTEFRCCIRLLFTHNILYDVICTMRSRRRCVGKCSCKQTHLDDTHFLTAALMLTSVVGVLSHSMLQD